MVLFISIETVIIKIEYLNIDFLFFPNAVNINRNVSIKTVFGSRYAADPTLINSAHEIADDVAYKEDGADARIDLYSLNKKNMVIGRNAAYIACVAPYWG